MSYVFTLTPPQNIFYSFCLLIKNEVAILQKGQLYKEIFKYILKYFYIFIGIYENNVGFLTKMIHYYINVIEM
ncbi:hypothetical protein JSCD13_23260 [Clostridioides difficile]|nr:hypothetical protein JSCD10_25480 [Clostridioides difficile]GMK98603.1 hypothetical protein JSCD11_29380 [Clostridioides difficile]GML05226.1 hypothetical protein JSCD13_23260 [Clostridioides difficile]